MRENKWWLLQLFAEGGEGSAAGSDDGAAAETGVSDVAAGHQRLRELGVPESKIRKNRSYKVSAAAKAPVVAEQAAEQETTGQDDAATENPEQEQTKRMTWDEIKADPEYSAEIQNIVQQRLKKSKGAEEALEHLTPALQGLAKVYGMDPQKIDYQALAGKIREDDRFYEGKSLETGLEPSITRRLEQYDLMMERESQSVKDRAMQQHYGKLMQQGEALKAKYPTFDLNEEIKNPTFARMVAPGVGLSVEDAYYTVHRKEIEQAALKAATEQTAKNMANAVRSGTMRPQENGSTPSAPSVSSFSYKNASKEQRDALKQRIRLAGARGEKIYPGQ